MHGAVTDKATQQVLCAVPDQIIDDTLRINSWVEEIMRMIRNGDIHTVCVEQPCLETMYVDLYVNSSQGFDNLLNYYAAFSSPHRLKDEADRTGYNLFYNRLFLQIRAFNQKVDRPVHVIGLDYTASKMENKHTWATFPISRRHAAFNKAALTDSLEMVWDNPFDSKLVAPNTSKMMKKNEKAIRKTIGDLYYIQWNRLFEQIALQQTKEDEERNEHSVHASYLKHWRATESELPDNKLVLGCMDFLKMLVDEDTNNTIITLK